MDAMLSAVNSLMFLVLFVVCIGEDIKWWIKMTLVFLFLANGVALLNASGYVVRVHQ